MASARKQFIVMRPPTADPPQGRPLRTSERTKSFIVSVASGEQTQGIYKKG